LYCPETLPTFVTAEKVPVSFADDDKVIPPNGTVDPAKIDDENRDTVVETNSGSSDEFATAPTVRRTATSTRLHRKMLPRRRDAGHHSEFYDNATEEDNSLDRNKQKMFYIGESDNDDLSYLRTGRSPSNTAGKRHAKGLREKKYFTDTSHPGKYSIHNRYTSSQYRTGKTAFHSPNPHKQIITARSSDGKPRISPDSHGRTERPERAIYRHKLTKEA